MLGDELVVGEVIDRNCSRGVGIVVPDELNSQLGTRTRHRRVLHFSKKLEDTKGVTRSNISEDRQYNGLKGKQRSAKNTTQKTTDRATRSPLKTGECTLG